MNIARFCIERRIITVALAAVLFVGGLIAYEDMSRLEDPEFTIKDALIVTSYPGASALEVEQEITDEIELAVQQLAQVKRVTSRSEPGRSTVTVTIKDRYGRTELPQVWDALRRKVTDVQAHLPPGAETSTVIDDYGDVFGIFAALYGHEYTYAELKQVADFVRRELLLVQDVAKVELFAEQTEAIFIEFSRDRMAELGIPKSQVINELQQRNLVSASGNAKIGPEYVRIDPSGSISAQEDFGSILIGPGRDQQIYLRDVATIHRGYIDPPDNLLHYDGNLAIGIGVSTVSGGNVVKMGEAIQERIEEMLPRIPLGIEVGMISLQSEAVTEAINDFTSSLLQALAIVIIVLLFFMGLRSGLIIGFALLLTISGSFIALNAMGVALERISLGALIIALGMLVDNAIVIVDGVLVRMQRGENAKDAAIRVVGQSAIPLLGATLIAILAFAAIGTSQDNTGEFTRSLFQVILVSLILSWIIATTIIPLLCVQFLKQPEQETAEGQKPEGPFYRTYRQILRTAIRNRPVTLGLIAVVFIVALWGFRHVDQSFFPPSTRAQVMVDVWLPQGTHINTTEATAREIEDYLLQQDDVLHVTSLIGQGGLRFLLTYTPEKTNSSYIQFLVDIKDPDEIQSFIQRTEAYLFENSTDAQAAGYAFELGPGANGKIRARFSGPDTEELRRLAHQTADIFQSNPNAKAVRTDWRNRVKVVRPVVSHVQANLNGITQPDISRVFQEAFEGAHIGVYREKDLLLPIMVRATAEQRTDISSIQNLQIWSPASESMIPMRQVVSRFETVFENDIIMRRDRKRTITVLADPISGPASALFQELKPQIEDIPLKEGYTLEWGGEQEDSTDARQSLLASVPLFFLFMVLITIGLFNSLLQPLVIWLCVPLALIGVTTGLLVTGQPFGFMALLGFLSLSGMLIKNAIVLVDEINLESRHQSSLASAIVNAGVSRLRPVTLAAMTTALGMIPLLFDAFFVSMAVTIIAGLVFATVLTMIFLPVAYSLLARVSVQDLKP